MGCLCVVLFVFSIYCVIGIVINPKVLISHSYAPYIFDIAFFTAIASLAYFVWTISKDRYNELSDRLSNEYKRKLAELDKLKIDLKDEFEQKNRQLNNKESEIKDLLHSATPFKRSASLIADLESLYFDDCSRFLKYKRHPARTAAMEVLRIKREAVNYIKLYKEIEFKYEYILNAFPEIQEYVQSDEDLLYVGEHCSYNDLDDMHDYRKDYLSQNEYNQLSEDEKSQLALDRYLSSKKSKWEIGRDYEMSCAMQMQKRGYRVELHGIKYKLEDLGRDLIAKKTLGGMFGEEILIIQCKNWSKERTIHENVIYQLFGTSIEYQIYNNKYSQEIIPVLMIPPHCSVSEMAVKVAERLKIRIERVPFSDFPRIKCNINHGERIYHLPFDQLYDRVEIKLPGEFYAWNVAEASRNGFRRAKRHIISENHRCD